MASTVQLKRSAIASKVPLTTDLALGEIAINTYDGKIFIKKDNGTQSIVEIGAGGGGGGATNLTYAANTSAVTVNSDTGTDAIILAANSTIAGVLTSEAQTIGGIKTFSANVVFSGAVIANSSPGSAGQVLYSSGTSTYWAASSGGTTISATIDSNIVLDTFTGDGSTSAFTLSATPVSDKFCFVYVNGVAQSDSSYNVSSSSLTFVTTPASGDEIEVRTFVPYQTSSSNTLLSTTSSNQVIDTFPVSGYRSVKYLVQMSHASAGYHSTEVLLIHDGTNTYQTEYATIYTASSLGTIDSDISAGSVRILVTPTNANTTVKTIRTQVTP